jgi:hypothetical protein
MPSAVACKGSNQKKINEHHLIDGWRRYAATASTLSAADMPSAVACKGRNQKKINEHHLIDVLAEIRSYCQYPKCSRHALRCSVQGRNQKKKINEHHLIDGWRRYAATASTLSAADMPSAVARKGRNQIQK